MRTADERARALLRKGRPARSRDFVAAGIPRSRLSRMVAAGRLVRLGRGLYAAPGYQPGEQASLIEVARRAPKAVFCLLTALRLHDLTTQAPFEVWIAIGNKAYPPRLDYPNLRVVRFSGPALTEGTQVRRIDGTEIRVTNVAKTVADCFKFRNKIGLDVALEALREALRAKKTTMDDLWRYARIDRVANVMRPYLEAVG
jgi:predicted transcriptional regulator of viral defense system